jgi:hypothetical protein
LDLANRIAIRARAKAESRCTEIRPTHSTREGKPVRIVVDRRHLKRALKLGLRTFSILDPDKPVLCFDEKHTYVWVPLNSRDALAPQRDAILLPLSSVRDEKLCAIQSSGPVCDHMPPAIPSLAPLRLLARLAASLRGLWSRFCERRQA